MHTKLLLLLFLFSFHVSWSQKAVTPEGRLTTIRSEFINHRGRKSTLEGVESSGKINSLPPCSSMIINHVTSRGVAPVARTITYALAYVTLSGFTKCWLQQNLGATVQATSAYDASDAAAGWNWQWGRKQGFQLVGTTRTPNTAWITSGFTPTSVNWPADNDPCTIELGSGWRLPSYNEWRAFSLVNTTTDAVFASELKIHNAGYIRQTSTPQYLERGLTSHYWSFNNGNITNQGWAFSIPDPGGNPVMSNNDKEAGFTIRCIRD